MNYSEIDPNTYDKYTFGECMRIQRQEQGLRMRDLASEIDCSMVYVRDIELGNKYAPRKLEDLTKLAKKLNIREEDLTYFYDMASATRGYYEDIKEYIQENKSVRDFLRYARSLNLTDAEWTDLIIHLNEINNNRNTRTR